jgi:hypothetical protein
MLGFVWLCLALLGFAWLCLALLGSTSGNSIVLNPDALIGLKGSY